MTTPAKRRILAQRRAYNEAFGDEFLYDVESQRELRFEWNGVTVSDRCGPVELGYFYPSALGTSLFLHGSFEEGEIAIAAAILRQIEDPVIIDVGANIGLHSVEWCAASPTARIFACEPVPKNVVLLERNVDRNGFSDRVEIAEIALDRAVGTSIVYESADGAYSALDESKAQPVVARHVVQSTTIDEFVAKRTIARVDLLKVDVEGHEFAVLEGATETLRRDAPFLFVEISGNGGVGPSPDEGIARLLALGYRCYAINHGIVTEYHRHDDATYNYLFAHPRRGLDAPVTQSNIAREELHYLSYQRARAEHLLLPFTLESKALKQTAEERLSVLAPVKAALAEQRVAAQERLELADRLAVDLAAKERERAELADALDAMRFSKQAGWYPVERQNGEAFRWASDSAAILVTEEQLTPFTVEGDVEPGPSLGGAPLVITFENERGEALAQTQPTVGRSYIQTTLPPLPAGTRLRLMVESKGVKVANDSRTLNFRIFDLNIVSK